MHGLPQKKERQLTKNWYNFRIDKTTKGSKLITSVIFPIPSEILLKCIINFIRKIFLPVFGNSSAYGEIEKLDDQKDFIISQKLGEFHLRFTYGSETLGTTLSIIQFLSIVQMRP